MACLSLIQLVAFLLIVQIWPIALAAVKLISGWIGITIISASLEKSDDQEAGSNQYLSFRLYKLALMGLFWVAIIAVAPQINDWLPIGYKNLISGLVFFLGGILFLCVHEEVMDTIIGLMVMLAGFDIIYSSLEGSALVAGIYSIILISISILGSYLQRGDSSRSES